MATQAEYSTQLRPLLSEGFQKMQPPPGEMALAAEFSVDDLSDKLGGILAELERQHRGASTHIQSLLAREAVEPWEGEGELAFVLYYLHNPPPDVRAEIDAVPGLKLLWDALARVAPAPAFTPEQFGALGDSLTSGATVYCNKWGDIYGLGTYEQLDPGWAWTLVNDLINRLPKWMGKGCGIREFAADSWSAPVKLQAGTDGKVRIAIIGDWGSGAYQLNGLQNPKGPACAVMEILDRLETKPDYLIHLGDTYYAGTGPNRAPHGEEAQNLAAMLHNYPALAKAGKCFTLNSNHEMYGGAHGFFDVALTDPLFSAQRGCSYFALEFGNWIIAGIDSAYFDPSALYMDGGLGGRSNPQYAFLAQIAQKQAQGKKVILMSHHTGISTDGASTNEPLWSDVTVTGKLKPDYWYWGHTHLGMVYNARAASGAVNARCIGHGSMPFAVPPGMENCANVSWYSKTPLSEQAMLAALWYSRPRAANGFAMLTLDQDGITEEIYSIDSTTPVWPPSV